MDLDTKKKETGNRSKVKTQYLQFPRLTVSDSEVYLITSKKKKTKKQNLT